MLDIRNSSFCCQLGTFCTIKP